MSQQLLDCRACAALCLTSIKHGQSLNRQLPVFEKRIHQRDRALFRQLCYGVLRLYPQLEAICQLLLQKPLKAKDCDLQMLMLVGAYQLTATRIPAHAAVSATVAATKTLKKTWAKALVNGVLRQWQRQGDKLTEQLTNAQRQAHPQWLHDQLIKAWGAKASHIEQENNQHPPMCLRVNQQRISTEEYLHLLQESAIEADTCEFAHSAVRLHKALGVEHLPGFSNGLVSVQDEAAQLAASLLALEPGQRVLDACCAPGGKTCHILETEPNIAEVVALDVDSERLKKVSQNLARLQLKATLVAADATQTEDWWDGQVFDRILLDAPCSGTGVIRRNPDIKLQRQPSDIRQLAHLQCELLEALWPTLKTNGVLLYATCSVLPDENERVIEQFCQRHPRAQHISMKINCAEQRPFGYQLFPQRNGHDGFYYAALQKKRSRDT